MTEVKPRPGESIEALLSRFKKAVENSGILTDYRKNERYEKPSVKRKKKQIAARKRRLKNKRNKPDKVSKTNWRWNKNHTKKIPLQTYTTAAPGSKSKYHHAKDNKKKKSAPLTKEQIDRVLNKRLQGQNNRSFKYKGSSK